MRATKYIGVAVAVGSLAAGGCDSLTAFNEDCSQSSTVVGVTGVDLDLRESTVRRMESAVGDLVADANLAGFGEPQTVAAIQNAGAIRAELCAGGERESIPAGPITTADVDDLLPFENYLTTVTLTGSDLKSSLERAVSALPEQDAGWFLQVSGMSFSADCALQRQVLSVDETEIITEGERVSDIIIAGEPWSETASYTIVANDFIASGEDGFLAMKDAITSPTLVLQADALKSYLATNSPVAPTGTGRITLTGCETP